MTCEITITSVDVFGTAGGPVASVKVSGTAVDCMNLVVNLSCGGPVLQRVIAVNAQNTPVSWTVLFDNLAGSGCTCGEGFMRISAHCKEDETCQATWPTLAPPECQLLEPVCPEIGEITTSPPQECFAPGEAIKLNVSVYDPGGCITQYLWIFSRLPGQCSGGPEPDCPGGSLPLPIIKSTPVPTLGLALAPSDGFSEGNWTVQVMAVLSSAVGCAGCPPVASPVLPFSILQPGACPEVIAIGEPVITETPSGYECQFTAQLTGNTQEARVRWNFGSGLETPTCLCGEHTVEASHTYPRSECGKHKTASLLVEPGNNCCAPVEAAREFDLPPCEGGDGDGGGGHPCPWWNPFCKGWSLCAGLLAAAMAAILAAGILLLFGNCLSNPGQTTAGLAAAALSLFLLALWYWLCSKTQADFCDTLDQLILFLAYLIAAQGLLLLVVYLIALITGVEIVLTCSWMSFAYYGTILAYLEILKHQAC